MPTPFTTYKNHEITVDEDGNFNCEKINHTDTALYRVKKKIDETIKEEKFKAKHPKRKVLVWSGYALDEPKVLTTRNENKQGRVFVYYSADVNDKDEYGETYRSDYLYAYTKGNVKKVEKAMELMKQAEKLNKKAERIMNGMTKLA